MAKSDTFFVDIHGEQWEVVCVPSPLIDDTGATCATLIRYDLLQLQIADSVPEDAYTEAAVRLAIACAALTSRQRSLRFVGPVA